MGAINPFPGVVANWNSNTKGKTGKQQAYQTGARGYTCIQDWLQGRFKVVHTIAS